MGRALLPSEGKATRLIEVLRSYVAAHKFQLHDFFVRGVMTLKGPCHSSSADLPFDLRKQFRYRR
jgi:hypothetical protein